MSSACGYCAAPIAGRGLLGPDRPGRPTATYCCSGCLGLAERGPSGPGGVGALAADPVWIKLGIAALLAAQTMVLGLAINLSPPEGDARLVLQGLVLAGTAAVVGLLGWPLARSALVEARRGRVTIEALFVAGVVGSLLASGQSMIRGRGPIYFEVASVLLVVYNLGRALGARGRAAALASAREWVDGLQTCRRLDQEGLSVSCDVAAIVPGDRVEVWPGEAIGVDGVVVDGVGFAREAAMTGEPLAVVRRPGDRVWAGTIVEDARLVVRADCAGNSRRIDRLIEAVERARLAPSSLQGEADRLAARFVPAVIAVAVATFAGWSATLGWEVGLFRAMSVLLIACPCSLGLATPIVVWATLGRLAKLGLIARDGTVVERLAGIDSVIFDKTGTLTEDRLALVDLVADDVDRADLLDQLARLADGSTHPVLRSFAGRPSPDDGRRVGSFRLVPGMGVEAEILDADGPARRFRVGSEAWLGRSSVDPRMPGQRVLVEVDGQVRGVALLAESPRASASGAIAQLEALGLPVAVVTGDTAEHSQATGFPAALAGASPEAKRAFVAGRIAQGARPLFVGDGINDAAALATAFASIAPGSGSAIAVEAASATLHGGDLVAIPEAVALCRTAVARLRWTLRGAAAYNLVGIALAASGWLHPIAAAALMAISSLWVVGRAARASGPGTPIDCHWPILTNDDRWLNAKAWAHGIAMALQGPILAALAGLGWAGATAMTVGFATAGWGSARIWRGRSGLTGGLDLAYGMATLGNLGMLAGWWLDAGFRTAAESGGCGCGAFDLSAFAGRPGMWLGMLGLGNLAMARLGRSGGAAACSTLGWVGCNLGMVAGMAIGGRIAAALPFAAGPIATIGSAALMAIGMTIAMAAGHGFARLTAVPRSEARTARA